MGQKKELVKLMITLGQLHTIEVHVNTFFELRFELLQDEVAQFNVRLLQLMIVDDGVKVAGRCSVSKFSSGCVQSLLKTFLGFCVSLSQALLQLFDGWRLNEY